MFKFIGKYFTTFLALIGALGLAGCAAYFSITGLGKLFAGSALEVIIMASFLEAGKLITASLLHRYWKVFKPILKIPLTLMVIIIMGITSSGIYGFLANAYSKTSVELDKVEGQIELVEKQQEQKREQIDGIEEIKDSKSDRMSSLVDLREQQEVRLDSLLANHHWQNAKRTQEQIDQATEEIGTLQTDIDSLITKINTINEEIGVLDIDILNLQNNDVAVEIGPLKYMANVLEKPMDNIINWFILALIFSFDPLAVLLVIVTNIVYDRAKNGKQENKAPPEDDDPGVLGKLKSGFWALRERLKKDDNPQREVEEPESLEEDPQGEVEEPEDDVDYSFSYGEIEDEAEAEKALKDDVIEYVTGEDGEFKKSDASDSLEDILKGIDSNPVYIQLVDALFADGKRKNGDTLPSFKEKFEPEIRARGIDCEHKIIINFLKIAGLLRIVDLRDKDENGVPNVKIIRDYDSSKQIISMVSK